MGRLNLVQVLNQVAEETFNPDFRWGFKFSLNPYWGLKCNRGAWLTRFPSDVMPIDPAFMMAFIKAGGNLDAMGHYGLYPRVIKEKEAEGWSLSEIRLLAKGVPAEFCRIEGVTEVNWKIYQRGLSRAEALEKNGIGFECSIWTLGRKPVKWFLKKLFNGGLRGTKFSQNQVVINHYLVYRPASIDNWKGRKTKINEAVVIDGFVYWDVENFLPKKFLAYCRKCTKPKNYWNRAVEVRTQKVNFFGNFNSAKTFAKKAEVYYNGTLFMRTKNLFLTLDTSRTSAGNVALIHPSLLVSNEGGKIFTHAVRQVAGYSVCQIRGTWFVWKGNFPSHFEGKGSLKSVINMAERRTSKNSLVLALNDVRNDRPGTAGYCISGTKGFLQNRMPWVYQLIKNYSSWSEVPEEFMSLEWTLASRDIFKGYPSPLN